MGKISNFGGKKAAPFQKGGKRRKAVLAVKRAKAAKMVAGAKKTGKGGPHRLDQGLSNTGATVDLAKLTTAQRKALPSSAFVFPGKRAYPIHDKAHAENALARSAGKPEHPVVVAAVKRRYPALGK